jgi:hypothetical protein
MSQNFLIGLDLGQAQDYTALAIVERFQTESSDEFGFVQHGQATYQVRWLERARGTPYPQIVTRVWEVLRKVKDAELVVDQTGVGAPVVDMFKQAGLEPAGILIHGGARVSHEETTWGVPKRDLAAVLQVLLQNGRLKVASELELADVLIREMLNFKVKIDPLTAHDSYSAWREAEHDDLVFAVALACWYGEHVPRPQKIEIGEHPITGDTGYTGMF